MANNSSGFLLETNNFTDVCNTTESREELFYILTNLQLQNGTPFDNMTTSSASIELFDLWVSMALTTIGGIGVIGNLVNLAVLRRRALVSKLNRMERYSSYGLSALAVSDLLMCLLVIPYGVLMDARFVLEEDQWFALYYRVYGVACIKLFTMVSMWLVVSMAIRRYVIAVYPLRVRFMFSKNRTMRSILIAYVVPAALSTPHFLHLKIQHCHLIWDFEVKLLLSWETYIEFYIRWLWPFLAVLLPSMMLLIFNCKLAIDLRMASKYRRKLLKSAAKQKGLLAPRRSGRHHSTNKEMHLTLVTIVVVNLLLVTPIEIIRLMNIHNIWNTNTAHLVTLVGHCLQASGFACNFVLYFLVNPKFRTTLKEMICKPHPFKNAPFV